MPISHVLLDNGKLGKITKEQRAGECDVWQTCLHNPDFAAFAFLCGAAWRADRDGRGAAGRPRARPVVEGPALVSVASDPDLI